MGLPGIHGEGEVLQWTGEMLDSWLDITFSDTQGSGQVGGGQSPVSGAPLLSCFYSEQ